ncbi:MAG: hypothetical protein SGARI_002731 [Bacillariaceae sp.]
MEDLLRKYSQEQVDDWMLNPTFSDESLLVQPVPIELGEEDDALWAEIQGDGDFLVFKSKSGLGVTGQAMLAAKDIMKLETFYEMHGGSEWPAMLILLAECHFLLNDTRGARIKAAEAQTVVGVGQDKILDQCVDYLRVLEYREIHYQDEFDDDGADIIIRYTKPQAFSTKASPSKLIDVRKLWTSLKQLNGGCEQFMQTNVIEGVFDIVHGSTMKLALEGFSVESIEGISDESHIKEKDKILQVLEDALQCYNAVKFDRVDFTEKGVKMMHASLMKENKLEMATSGDGEIYPVYTPTGLYRCSSGFTTQVNSDDTLTEIQYCPPAKLEEDMEWYFREAKKLLSGVESSNDPFRAAAWIQWAFVRIHPFADGNGRMCRLLSSIPLVLNDLPPVHVSATSKSLYFQALTKADQDGDIYDLARFLQDEAVLGLGQLLQANDANI